MKNLTNAPKGSGRSAFTLVELLLVVSIIAVLASLGVGVMAQAQNDAAQSATRSRISLIEKILETELEDYEVKRSPVPVRLLLGLVRDTGNQYADRTQELLHVKNLKRIIIADLIRAEMPDGANGSVGNLGAFPSDTLLSYLGELSLESTVFPTFARSPWGTWDAPVDGADYNAVERSEILYRVLLSIDLDGVPAVEQIGAQAIADTYGNGDPEIVDAWGEPIFLQWQQENLDDAGSVEDDIWGAPLDPAEAFVGLSKESSSGTVGFTNSYQYAKPVLPTQIRPFLFSARLNEIDGLPTDYAPSHRFD